MCRRLELTELASISRIRVFGPLKLAEKVERHGKDDEGKFDEDN